MAEGSDVVTKVSPWSISDTLSRLVAVINASDYRLIGVVDYGAEAEALGVEPNQSKLAIFGDPETDAIVMKTVPFAALDLTLKVLVWSDQGTTLISYLAHSDLSQRYDLDPDLLERLPTVDSVTEAVIAL